MTGTGRGRPVLCVLVTAAITVPATLGGSYAFDRWRVTADCGAPRVALTAAEGAPSGISARVCLVRQTDGRALRVWTSGFPASAGGFYEMWLVDQDGAGDQAGQRRVSLGTVGAGPHADHPLARSVDPARYRVVEISVEPVDGNPGYSGLTVLRGTLS